MMHSVELMFGWYVPAAQIVQAAVDVTFAYVPIGHAAGASAPGTQNEPMGHAAHWERTWLADCAVYVPGGQSTGATAPSGQ